MIKYLLLLRANYSHLCNYYLFKGCTVYFIQIIAEMIPIKLLHKISQNFKETWSYYRPLYSCGTDIDSYAKGAKVFVSELKRPEHESEYKTKVYNKWRFNTLTSIQLDLMQTGDTWSHEKKTCALLLTVLAEILRSASNPAQGMEWKCPLGNLFFHACMNKDSKYLYVTRSQG